VREREKEVFLKLDIILRARIMGVVNIKRERMGREREGKKSVLTSLPTANILQRKEDGEIANEKGKREREKQRSVFKT
jgi:hypothetical protein